MKQHFPANYGHLGQMAASKDIAPFFWLFSALDDALAVAPGRCGLLWLRILGTTGIDGVCRVPIVALASYVGHQGFTEPFGDEELEKSMEWLLSERSGYCHIEKVEGGYRPTKDFRTFVDHIYSIENARRQRKYRAQKIGEMNEARRVAHAQPLAQEVLR